MSRTRKLRGKKLLVASAGIAAASFLGCGTETSGNLVAPPQDAGADAATGSMDSGAARDAGGTDTGVIAFDASLQDAVIANLVAPFDAGPEDQ